MKEPKEVLRIFEPYAALIENEIRSVLDAEPRLPMYGMMRYFFGFADSEGNPLRVYGGKRFRSGLCMLIADFLGKKNEALEVAAAIEIFHNFTLIHDDIEDRDQYRRGRPTVWKLWGINHGINSGDGQLILAHKTLTKAVVKYPSFGLETQQFLESKFLEVIEGQFLDFTLTDLDIGDSRVDEALYCDMIAKKTVALVGASTAVVGIIAGVSKEAEGALWNYGSELGMSYQLCDDIVSIWGDPSMTGKTAHNDIRERKKTLPLLFLKTSLSGSAKDEFFNLYQKEGELSEEEIQSILQLLNENGAYDYAWKEVQKHAEAAKRACDGIPISQEGKDILIAVVDALLPEVGKNRVQSELEKAPVHAIT